MTDAGEHRFPDDAGDATGEAETRDPARRRPRAFSIAATAILLAGALALVGELAWARGGNIWTPVVDVAPHDDAPPVVDVRPAPKRKETRAYGLAVCVRLCDGFFFPSVTSSGGDEACALQCPDAPTARYTERAGSDSIDDAVSTTGAPYSALPVAYRYRTTFDNTCTCHHSPPRAYSALALADPTLQKGDVVMTPKGFLVFQGAKTRSVASSGFVALSQAPSLPKELRAALIAMERAGASVRQVGVGLAPGASASASAASTPLTPVISAR